MLECVIITYQKYAMLSLSTLIRLFISLAVLSTGNTPTGPSQPPAGLGGSSYAHDDIKMIDFADEPHGYWLFEPASPKPDTAPVVIFLHGYGAINPMVYGGWIRHMVRKGNIVIFPRYQKNMISPRPTRFDINIARAISNARVELQKDGHIKPDWSQLIMVGHSYGAAMSAYFASEYAQHQVPKPKGIMLCAPGTGPAKAGRLKSYAQIPEDIAILLINNAEDRVVGDSFQHRIISTAQPTPFRNMLRQVPDDHGEPKVQAGHNECYSLDKTFDTGLRNPTVVRSFRVGQTDAVDYFGYWKLFDAMSSCLREDKHCDIAFGFSDAQLSLGNWSDGQPIKPLIPVTITR